MFLQFSRVFKKGFALLPGPLGRNTGSSRFPIGLLAIVIIVFSVASLTLDVSSAATGKTPASFNADRLHPKLPGSATANSASAAPKIVFGSVRNGGNHDIFVMDVDGSNQTRLTTSAAYDDQPKWSRDGTKIVFMSNRDGNFEIYSMNADGSNQTRLTNNPAADGFPAWSPDGTKIAFVSGDLRNPSTFEIYVMNADGSNRTRLTNDSLVDGVPAWSPDGTKIVFMSGTTSVFDPNSFEIFVMNADGSNRTRLTNNTVADGQPSFSPDGTKILFASGDAMNPNGIEIFVMNANGTGRTQLTNNSVTDGFPVWSSDGSRIVFASGSVSNENTVELYMMNADGSNPTQLTNNSALDWFPDWQPLQLPVSGQVTDIKGVGIGGVAMTISGAPSGLTLTSLTDGAGNYSFNNSVGGDTLTPSKTGLVFDPSSVRAVSSGGPTPITGAFNFIGGTATYILSGRVIDGTGAGLSNILVTVTGSQQRVEVTDGKGNYAIGGLFAGGNFTFRPSQNGFFFNPSAVGFTNLPPGNRVVPTFVGTMHPYTISGQVKDKLGNPLSSVFLTLHRVGGSENLGASTNASGNYSFSNVASEATYSVTPAKAGFSFSPASATFSNPSGNQTANFTATPLPTVQFGASTFTVGNGDIKATITVTRTGDLNVASNVDYATSDGTASQQVHYTISTGTLAFAANDTSKQFSILMTDGANTSYPATVNLTLSNPVGATLGSPSAAVLTINQNHSWPPGTNPADDASFFVRQQYSDFLNREPDPMGFSFWVGQITQCGNDPTCVRNKRIDVSNAFFYELEYQQTGSYVDRLYRAAFGNNQPFPNPIPDPNHPGEEKKVVSYQAFVQDRARVVGGSNLAQSQLDLANAFVLRPDFLTKYSASLDGPSFVDAVLATIKNDIGVDLISQRTALINLFNSGGRGAVLYRLADDNVQTNPINNRSFIDAEYNRAFVATQYFGYLRRDADMAGFLFWLGQVSSAPLRDVPKQHAMVCSFVTSAEYQQRFSPVVTHSNAECPR